MPASVRARFIHPITRSLQNKARELDVSEGPGGGGSER